MIRKLHLRAVPALLVVAAALTLAACSGTGNLPAGQAYLTISNTNPAGNSAFDYTTVFVDSKSLPTISSGNSYRTAVTIGQHDVTLYFQGKQVGPNLISVPTQGCTLLGPTQLIPTQMSGC